MSIHSHLLPGLMLLLPTLLLQVCAKLCIPTLGEWKLSQTRGYKRHPTARHEDFNMGEDDFIPHLLVIYESEHRSAGGKTETISSTHWLRSPEPPAPEQTPGFLFCT